MKNVKSNVAKSLVLIALLCPVAFADGEQGSGGFAGNDSAVKGSCSIDGEQGSGGLRSGAYEDPNYLDSVLNSIYEYFDSMI